MVAWVSEGLSTLVNKDVTFDVIFVPGLLPAAYLDVIACTGGSLPFPA